jgi:hypothetical protein
MDVAFMCYWGRPNDDVFETCVNTFSKHSKALLQVHSRVYDLSKDYGLRWVNVPKREVKGRRALCKIEQLARLVKQLKAGSRLLVMDADLYFLDDPFKAFEKEFDVALTTRCHEYRWPVNGGVFFIRVNSKTKQWMKFHLEQCQEPTWHALLEFRKSRKAQPYTPDWEIGQDFLCATWLDRVGSSVIPHTVDVGYQYNFCPNTDIFGLQKARKMIKDVYNGNSVKILHLKSELKLCIYDGYMEDAITKRCNGRWNWYESKPAIQPE